MELETERVFEFENVEVTIKEKFTENISGAITQHGAHLWPAAPVLAAAVKVRVLISNLYSIDA